MNRFAKPRPKRHGDQSEGVLHHLLDQEGAELSARKQLLREELAAEPGEPRDEADCCADNFARDIGVALVEATSRTVKAIEQALARLRHGCYGDCLECGDAIATARLRALPFAERCRVCQERHEPARCLPTAA